MKRDGKKKRPTRLKQNGINPKHFSAGQLKIHAYLVPICVIMALPIVFIISNAFKPIDELMAYPPRFFVRRPTLDNFISLFNLSSSTSIPASRYLFNSVITTVITVLGALIICACAAYVFSKKRFKFNGVLFKINSLALMFVPIAVSIPRYFVIT
ncbi:MAG TPA: ABC transporter permease, partial [Ruminococcaceae bacterium]|nr:ABC transporter permease [Oscillospiraceae bacterium]